MFLIALPLAMQAQKSNDINKPTRERVKNKDKNQTKKSQATTTDQSNKAPAASTTNQKGSNTKTTSAKDAKKEGDAAPAADIKVSDKPAADTTGKKAAEAAPVKKKKRVDPSTVQYDGIDVSKHQGAMNWGELKQKYNVKFVYIKATEGGSYQDPRYKEYIREARKHGFKVGSYHFFRTTSSAQDQFVNFVKTVNREEQDLLPMIDIEEKKYWTEQQLRDSVKVFADLVENYYGCKPLIYTGEKFYNDFLGLAFKHYPLFIAKYSDKAPNISPKWVLWQFSESGDFKGVTTNIVDMSRFNTGYSVKDITYVPSRHTPKKSVLDLVNRKPAPSNVTMTEQKKTTTEETKRQKDKEEEKAKAEKRNQDREKAKQQAAIDAKKKEAEKKAAAEKRIAEKKAAEKQAAEKKAAEKKAAEKRAAEKKAAEKAAQDAKNQRKAEAQKKREQKKSTQKTSSSKSSSLLQGTSSKLTQTQRNDSIRNANLKGRKTNKSSADND